MFKWIKTKEKAQSVLNWSRFRAMQKTNFDDAISCLFGKILDLRAEILELRGMIKVLEMSKGGWDDSFFSVVVVVVAFSDAVVSALEADHDLPEDQAVAHQREWQRLIIQKREKRKQCHSFRRRLHHNV